MKKRIFITGITGFVGAWLARALREDLPDALIINGDETGQPALNICDGAAVAKYLSQVKPDVIIHLAAQASARRHDPDGIAQTWQTNLVGSINIAAAVATHCPDATVLFASSSEVYGASFLGGKVQEQTPCFPLHSYGHSKLLAEQALANILPATARLIVARPFNHSGPGQGVHFVLPNFAAQIARIEAGLEEPCIWVGNIDVHREFLDVRDVARAYVQLVARAETLPSRVTCNVATGQPVTIRSLVEIFQQMSRKPFTTSTAADRLRANEIPVISGRSELLRSLTGWAPQVEIRDTLHALLEHARHQPLSKPA